MDILLNNLIGSNYFRIYTETLLKLPVPRLHNFSPQVYKNPTELKTALSKINAVLEQWTAHTSTERT